MDGHASVLSVSEILGTYIYIYMEITTNTHEEAEFECILPEIKHWKFGISLQMYDSQCAYITYHIPT